MQIKQSLLQHHDDLWHSGILEVGDKKIKSRGKEKKGKGIRRDRVPFRSFGVGIGAASWSRHFSALRDAGWRKSEISGLAGLTTAALEQDLKKVRERHECRPRDLWLMAVLDRFVQRRLKKLAPEITDRANGEYADFLKENYKSGKIGVKASKRRQIKDLEKEIENTAAILGDETGGTLTDVARQVRMQAYRMYEEESKRADKAEAEVRDLEKVTEAMRVSITRALLKDAPILLLDEATASVDTATEIQIQQALEALLKNRSSLIVAHRLSTVRNANIICVIKDGEIVEQGNHEELIKLRGLYYQLSSAQSSHPHESLEEIFEEVLGSKSE